MSNGSSLKVDDMNEAELDRLATMLALKRTLRALGEQREFYNTGHARRLAALDVEISTTQAKLDALSGGAS